MISCPKCNNTFSFSSRFKSLNKSEIECGKCKTKYKMKYLKLISSINVFFLIFIISPRLNLIFSNTTFLHSLIGSLTIALIWTFIIYFILSYLMKYEEIE